MKIMAENVSYTVKSKEHVQILLKSYMDGNKWCILFGEDLQEGISGFGDTFMEALENFEQKFYKIK